MLRADLRDRHLPMQRGQHQLELLLHSELAGALGLARLSSPFSKGAPDAISASAYGPSCDRVRQATFTENFSTPQKVADHPRNQSIFQCCSYPYSDIHTWK